MVRRKGAHRKVCWDRSVPCPAAAWKLAAPGCHHSLPHPLPHSDASILEAFNQATSPSFAERLFPYTMDNGIPQVRGRSLPFAADSRALATKLAVQE